MMQIGDLPVPILLCLVNPSADGSCLRIGDMFEHPEVPCRPRVKKKPPRDRCSGIEHPSYILGR